MAGSPAKGVAWKPAGNVIFLAASSGVRPAVVATGKALSCDQRTEVREQRKDRRQKAERRRRRQRETRSMGRRIDRLGGKKRRKGKNCKRIVWGPRGTSPSLCLC